MTKSSAVNLQTTTTSNSTSITAKKLQDKDGITILAPFNPTSTQAQHDALDLLSLSSDDVLFDLGCGDGRLLKAAALAIPGLKCVGVEMDEVYYRRAIESLSLCSDRNSTSDDEEEDPLLLRNRVHIRLGNVLDELQITSKQCSDAVCSKSSRNVSKLIFLEDATAVFVYLLPKGLEKLKPLLEEWFFRRNIEMVEEDEEWGLQCGHGYGAKATINTHRRNRQQKKRRVVSYIFRIPGWDPLSEKVTKGNCKVYLYGPSSCRINFSDSKR